MQARKKDGSDAEKSVQRGADRDGEHGECLRLRIDNIGENIQIQGLGVREEGKSVLASLSYSSDPTPGVWSKDTRKHIAPHWNRERPGNHEPLVPAETWAAVQLVLDGRGKTKDMRQSAIEPNFPLRRLVHCGVCEKPLTASWSKSHTGKRYAYYHCPRRSCQRIRREDLHGSFVELLDSLRPDPVFLEAVEHDFRRAWNELEGDGQAARQAAENRVLALKSRKRRLEQAYLDEVFDIDSFKENQGLLAEDLLHAEGDLHRLRSNQQEFEVALEAARALSLNPVRLWKRTPPELYETFFRTVFPAGVTIVDGKCSNPASTSLSSYLWRLSAETHEWRPQRDSNPGDRSRESARGVQRDPGNRLRAHPLAARAGAAEVEPRELEPVFLAPLALHRNVGEVNQLVGLADEHLV